MVDDLGNVWRLHTFWDGRRQRTGLLLRFPLISPLPMEFEKAAGFAE
jgi:hypothetical protein